MIDRSIFRVKGLFSTYLGLTCLILYTWFSHQSDALSYSLLILGLASFLQGVYQGVRFELLSPDKRSQQKA